MTQGEVVQRETEPSLDGPITRILGTLREALPSMLTVAQERAAKDRPRPYEPPSSVLRSEMHRAIHESAVGDIARLRFGFPTPKHKFFKTFVNVPQRTMGVQMNSGHIAYPDIVVVEHPENYVRIIAEVETEDIVTLDVARYEWLPYSQLGPLYLYVPVGQAQKAQQLCHRLHIPAVGIRTWRYVVGYDQIEINDYYTVPKGPEELLPKALRRAS